MDPSASWENSSKRVKQSPKPHPGEHFSGKNALTQNKAQLTVCTSQSTTRRNRTLGRPEGSFSTLYLFLSHVSFCLFPTIYGSMYEMLGISTNSRPNTLIGQSVVCRAMLPVKPTAPGERKCELSQAGRRVEELRGSLSLCLSLSKHTHMYAHMHIHFDTS